MNVKIEEINSIAKKLHFEIGADASTRRSSEAFRKIGKTAKIKGFRPGKIPLSVLEQYYGSQMEQEVLGRLINDTYFKALDEHAIPAVGEPRIVDSSGVEPRPGLHLSGRDRGQTDLDGQGLHRGCASEGSV